MSFGGANGRIIALSCPEDDPYVNPRLLPLLYRVLCVFEFNEFNEFNVMNGAVHLDRVGRVPLRGRRSTSASYGSLNATSLGGLPPTVRATYCVSPTM